MMKANKSTKNSRTSKNNTIKPVTNKIRHAKNNKNLHNSDNKKIILKNPVNRKKFALLLLLIFVIGVGATVLFYYNYVVLDIRSIGATVSVVEGVSGFDTSNKSLNFARISPGSGAIKYIDINTNKDVKVNIYAEGNISQFITFSEQQFNMQKNNHKQVVVMLDVPIDTQLGNYSGNVRVYFYRP
jgi:hypothetical protein